MSDLSLQKIRFANGQWEGLIEGQPAYGGRPNIEVRLFDELVKDARLTEGDEANSWNIYVPIPPHAIADGVQTFVIYDTATESKLGEFALIGDTPTSNDLRAEVELLRAELDMLKRAFRRHCLETS
ncbi:hypothetical protein GG681_05500 [Epibacterium sp. SM1969]|uniref:Uncharacterized protein n=1 Tax=Tritonibacter aquimaris TaxID=2663379 RepID=A0A844AY35_9RHOB|nr:hypothetical protein [Tritonibacter aquimaris]MQY42086.1 hypothetical protein [Tritonibacter aquimaris]